MLFTLLNPEFFIWLLKSLFLVFVLREGNEIQEIVDFFQTLKQNTEPVIDDNTSSTDSSLQKESVATQTQNNSSQSKKDSNQSAVPVSDHFLLGLSKPISLILCLFYITRFLEFGKSMKIHKICEILGRSAAKISEESIVSLISFILRACLRKLAQSKVYDHL